MFLEVLSDLRRRVLAAHRGGGLTCEQLRRDSRRNTYKTGSYFTDDGDLEELDRDLVEQAKQRLQNGEMLQRPLDLFDKAPVQKIEYSKETALVVAEDEDQRATKKRRGGALLRLRRSSGPHRRGRPTSSAARPLWIVRGCVEINQCVGCTTILH